MDKYKFYFNDATVDYYADYQDANGWAGTALEIYKFIADECEWHDESDMRELYLDLLEQVEDKIIEQL
jgi:hypothetical protein